MTRRFRIWIGLAGASGLLLAALLLPACAPHRSKAPAPPSAPSPPVAPPAAPAPPAPTSTPPATPPAPAASSVAPAPPPPPAEPGSIVAELAAQAKALDPLVKTPWVHRFLASASELPAIAPRTVYFDTDRTHFYSEQEAAALDDGARAGLTSRVLDEAFYYTGRYGTPLAYARPLDILGEKGFEPSGGRIVDFGYGSIGQLRILAGLGADVTGVEIDPVTRALYSQPGDQGEITGRNGTRGRLRVLRGSFPSEPGILSAVGANHRLFISKNTLKRGYVHPERPVPDRQRVMLGVEDDAFVRTLFGLLEPGGYVLVYNICPAPAPPDKPYIPWADGRSPFPKEMWESAGFQVLAFDENDDAQARAMGHALGWDSGDHPMDLDHDLFAWYTLLRKPA